MAVDSLTGKVLWNLKLGTEQRNSCPLYADGKIYAPIVNDPAAAAAIGEESAEGAHGALYVIAPGDNEGKILSHTMLEGRCFGTPTAYNGRIYMQTTKKLYCFGPAATASPYNQTADTLAEQKMPEAGPAHDLLVRPSELLLKPGDTASFHVRALDAKGLTVKDIDDAPSIHWASYIPPTAKVKATLKASFNDGGQLVAAPEKLPSAGAFEATVEPPTKFAYPPLPWIGARFKFDVREKDGNKCLVKTIDNTFFQRATVFMGTPDLKDYTIEADVMSDGNRRKMSTVGLINQRYRISLKGNEQVLE